MDKKKNIKMNVIVYILYLCCFFLYQGGIFLKQLDIVLEVEVVIIYFRYFKVFEDINKIGSFKFGSKCFFIDVGGQN